eukprot:312804-Chlamydomonas_euryale.AAC.5
MHASERHGPACRVPARLHACVSVRRAPVWRMLQPGMTGDMCRRPSPSGYLAGAITYIDASVCAPGIGEPAP